MSYDLQGNFSPDFFGDLYDPEKEIKPSNIANAILAITEEEREQIKKEVFNLPDHVFLSDDMIYEKILETNTVKNINSPVEVYIDEEGYFSVLVYDKE